MPKPITVERGFELSILVMIVGDAMTVIGVSEALGWLSGLGGWGFWSAGAGVVLSLVGTLWLISIVKRIRKFRALIVEKSKAVFVRNLDELEYTAWRLPKKYDVMVVEKKGEMGVR